MDLKNKASDLGIKYFLLAYSTLNMDSKFCVVPFENIENVQKNGFCCTPSRFFKCSASECGYKLFPVPETFIQLPWKQDFAWIYCEIYFKDAPFSQCPRLVFRKQIEKAKKLGYSLMAAFEPEFLLLDKESKDFSYSKPFRKSINLHDGHSIMRDSKLLRRIYEAMETLGWNPYQIIHEDSVSQYEINFKYADALETANRYFFLKFMVKELAEQEGYTATFMPLPSTEDLSSANGLHINLSLWSDQEKINLFPDDKDKELGISKLARHFIGGLLEHVRESCAVLCPTVNSYKRINIGSWCPSVVNWGPNDKSVMIRVPTNDRVEHRLPDGGTNLYLTLTLLLAAGLDGIEKNTEPGPMILDETRLEDKNLPNNLYEALSTMTSSDFVKECLGADVVEGFVSLKMQEWNLYTSQVTKWEKEFYFDC